jgi:hypothetical protein
MRWGNSELVTFVIIERGVCSAMRSGDYQFPFQDFSDLFERSVYVCFREAYLP